jgi:SAM-dependent methyltransferase
VTTYVFADGEVEETRLSALQSLLDGGTVQTLEQLGVRPGMRVLEVGAGAGSIARWLSERVGPSGRVTATDLDVRHLRAAGLPENVDVLEHDILAGRALPGSYDVVHARYVLEHVGDVPGAVSVMAGLLAPGGTLVLETSDPATAWLGLPEHPDVQALRTAFDQVFDDAGGDSYLGRTLPARLAEAGLTGIAGTAQARFLSSWTGPQAESYRLSVAEVADRMVDRGLITRARLESALRILESTPVPFLNHLTITVWGSRAG